eukprot:593169-Alexandrium_andersonii.AAC.1
MCRRNRRDTYRRVRPRQRDPVKAPRAGGVPVVGVSTVPRRGLGRGGGAASTREARDDGVVL